MLPVVSCFRQENIFLVIEAIGQSNPVDAWVFLSEVLGLQCIMDVSLDEDYSSSLLSFVNWVVGRFLDGGSKILCSKMELHVLNPFWVVSSKYFQSGEIELVQVRHVPKTEGTTKTWLVIWKAIDIHYRTFGFYRHVLV